MTRPRQTITVVPVERLTAHPGNIRDDLGDLTDLALSIREHGILQPLTATEHPTDPDKLVLLAGHRRLGGALLAHETRVPVIIHHGLDDESEQIVVMLVENTQRRDLSAVEKAQAYGALANQGLTLSEIARRVGCSPSTVSYYMNLLDLDERSFEKVRDGELDSTKAIAAVREARQVERERSGNVRRGRKREHVPPHFGPTHRLAAVVRQSCTHRTRPQLGGLGCGHCWEVAIVGEDQAARDQAARDQAARDQAAREVDPVFVERVATGDYTGAAQATSAERHAIVDRLVATGKPLADLERHLGWKPERYGTHHQAVAS